MDIALAKRVQKVKPSPTLAVAAKAAQMKNLILTHPNILSWLPSQLLKLAIPNTLLLTAYRN
jgi:hypothetical protein